MNLSSLLLVLGLLFLMPSMFIDRVIQTPRERLYGRTSELSWLLLFAGFNLVVASFLVMVFGFR